MLLALVRDGTMPLQGPPTSILGIHHGALWYYLLAPPAFLSGADPTAVVAEIALAGVAAVCRHLVAGSLDRRAARRVRGRAGDGPLVERHRGIHVHLESEPRRTGERRRVGGGMAGADHRSTGLVAGLGASLGVTIQSHILGIALVPAIVGMWLVTRRATPPGEDRRRLRLAGLAAIAVLVASYLPLIVHELRARLQRDPGGARISGLGRRRRLRRAAPPAPVRRAPDPGLAADRLAHQRPGRRRRGRVLVAAGLAWRAGAAHGRERTAARWLGATLLIGWLELTFGRRRCRG